MSVMNTIQSPGAGIVAANVDFKIGSAAALSLDQTRARLSELAGPVDVDERLAAIGHTGLFVVAYEPTAASLVTKEREIVVPDHQRSDIIGFMGIRLTQQLRERRKQRAPATAHIGVLATSRPDVAAEMLRLGAGALDHGTFNDVYIATTGVVGDHDKMLTAAGFQPLPEDPDTLLAPNPKHLIINIAQHLRTEAVEAELRQIMEEAAGAAPTEAVDSSLAVA